MSEHGIMRGAMLSAMALLAPLQAAAIIKPLSLILLLLATTHGVGATDSPEDEKAFTEWFKEISARGSQEAFDKIATGEAPAPGVYRVLSINDLDAPEAVKNHFRSGIAKRRAGVMVVPVGRISSASKLLAMTPTRVLPDAELRKRLPAPPSDVARTPLRSAKLINTNWCGTRTGIKSTGLQRIFLLETVGLIDFCEDSYRESKGARIEVFKEELNATVGDTPAMAHMERSVDGRGMAALSWVTPEKSFQLRLVTDDGASIEKGAALLMQIAEGIDR